MLAAAHKRCAQFHNEHIDRNVSLWAFYIFERIT